MCDCCSKASTSADTNAEVNGDAAIAAAAAAAAADSYPPKAAYLGYISYVFTSQVNNYAGITPPTPPTPSPDSSRYEIFGSIGNDVNDVIVKNVGRSPKLDLIVSRLELSHTLKNPTGKERRLAKALAKIADKYELILIDCAPTESILTDAAYHASRYALVPVKPEFLATIGLPLLARSIQEFNFENGDHALDICGIVFNQ